MSIRWQQAAAAAAAVAASCTGRHEPPLPLRLGLTLKREHALSVTLLGPTAERRYIGATAATFRAALQTGSSEADSTGLTS